jgi:hypothetical protein
MRDASENPEDSADCAADPTFATNKNPRAT